MEKDILSRREFFKNSLKKSLPFLAGVAMLALPTPMFAQRIVMNCDGDCTSSCKGTCEGSCRNKCTKVCGGTCKNTCDGLCQGTCKNCCGPPTPCAAVCKASCQESCRSGCTNKSSRSI